jgi:type II secretory pathway component PulL
MGEFFLVPGAEGWNLIGRPAENGNWRVRAFPTLEEAAQSLNRDDRVVLALPVSAVLAQRMRLPSVEGSELREMVRIQLEKALPFSAEEVTSDFEVIEQENGECVISAIAVQNQRLQEIAAPLLNRKVIPHAVTVYAAQRIATHAEKGRALFIYPESGALVSAISENGKLSFARTIDGGVGALLELELPQLTMTAELQGISASFENVLVDEKCFNLRERVESAVAAPAELMSIETPPASTALNLLPQAWRVERERQLQREQWKRRLVIAGFVYAAIVGLALIQLAYLKFRIWHLDAQIKRDDPRTVFVRAASNSWKALAPAVDPHFYPIEILQHLFESLPSQDVRITAYNQSARQISIEGEANKAALAYQFAEKVKKHPDLQNFNFDMQSPRILPNDHAQFRLEGRPR